MGIFGPSKKELQSEIQGLKLHYSTRAQRMIEAHTNALQMVINAEEETAKYKRLYQELLEENRILKWKLRESGVAM